MKNKDKNLEFDFENQKIGRPFTTPDFYFQNLEEQILNQTIRVGIEKSIHGKLVITWSRSIAAAMIAIGLLAIILLFVSNNNKEKENHLIVNTEDKKANIERDTIQLNNETEIVNNEYNLQQNNSEISTSDLESKQEKSNKIEIHIKEQSIQKPNEGYQLVQNPKNQQLN